MILAGFAFLIGLASVATLAMFATDGEKLWSWILLFLGIAYPYAAAPFIVFPEGYEGWGGDRFGEVFIYSMRCAVSSHIIFLGLGVSVGVLWVLYQEGTLQWVIRRVKGEGDEDWG